MRLYEKDDYAMIYSWFHARKMQAPPIDELPRIGFIESGVACGFLVETNCMTAFLDFLISNPMANIRDRSRAVTEITESLLTHAKAQGFRRVQCSSKYSGIARRALDLGFKELGSFKSFVRGI